MIPPPQLPVETLDEGGLLVQQALGVPDLDTPAAQALGSGLQQEGQAEVSQPKRTRRQARLAANKALKVTLGVPDHQITDI